jgi:thiosulfate/3-mercaptopyruvate sulfurtransferase
VLAESGNHRSARLLDARAPERYRGEVEPIDAVAGHVPGAVNHPFAASLGVDGRFLPPEALREAFAEQLRGVAPVRTIAMCGSGVTACHLLLAMEHAGLAGAKLYPGSWSEWSRDPSRPVARGAEP